MNEDENKGFNNLVSDVSNDNKQMNNNIDNQFWTDDDNKSNINNIDFDNDITIVDNKNVSYNSSNNDNAQEIDVKENFLNIIEENTNDDAMINKSIDMSNNIIGSKETISDTFDMNNIDVSQMNNNIQNDINNINQVQYFNKQINNPDQDMALNQQTNNFTQDINMSQEINNNVIENQKNMQNNNVVIDNNSNINADNNVINFANDNTNQNQIVDNNQSIDNNDNNELVRAYVGEKYDKIKNSSFSLSTFFLGSLYLFYRKMYLYGWLMMLLGPLAFIGYIILAITFKDVYFKHVNKKVNKIKLKNNNLSIEELKNICSKKGGTSIGMAILNIFGLFIILIITLLVLTFVLGTSFLIMFKSLLGNNVEINPSTNNSQNIVENVGSNEVELSKDKFLVEDVVVSGYFCMATKCNVSIESLGNSENYILDVQNQELIKILNDYAKYVKVNIYYIQKGYEKTIVDYKVLTKSNNEDISGVKNEEELRIKLGLYTLGTYTVDLTLKKIGTLGAGSNENNESYSYITYIFIDDNNIEYEMDYINPDNTLNLVEGSKYNVTFDVVEGMFGYEYTIKSIK